METLVIHPQNVCSREMIIEHEDGVIKSAKIIGGCQGNTTGVCALIVGRRVDEIARILKGIKCRGSRTGETSCPDQLSIGLEQIM